MLFKYCLLGSCALLRLVYGCNGGCSVVGCSRVVFKLVSLSLTVSLASLFGSSTKLSYYVGERRGKLGIHMGGVRFTTLLKDKVYPYELACTK